MKNYKALLYKKKNFYFKKFNLNQPEDKQIFVKNHYTGICGSDLHNIFGSPLRGNFKKWLSLEFSDGHELCGEVIKIGKKVTKFKIGDRVVSEAVYHCKKCENCKKNKHQICLNRKDLPWLGHGGFSEVSCIQENSAYKVPKNLPSDIAALAEPLASVIHGFNRSKSNTSQKILIIGSGTIGLLMLKFLNFKRFKNIYITTKHEHQKKVAKKTLKKKSIIMNEDLLDYKNYFDKVFECTGSEQAINLSLQSAKKGADVICLGTTSKNINFNYQNIINKEITLIGSLCYGKYDRQYEMDIALKTLANKKFKANDIITHKISFDNSSVAFNTAFDKRFKSIKVHLKF